MCVNKSTIEGPGVGLGAGKVCVKAACWFWGAKVLLGFTEMNGEVILWWLRHI